MSRTRAHKFFNRKILIISALIILILLVFAAYEYNQSKKRIKAPVIPSHPVQSDTSSKPPESSGKQPSSSSNNTNSTSSSGNSSGTLVAPFGSFVSNHQPGNGKPTTEESVCNTTPSAECYIQFVKDGVTKTLKTQTADSNGATIWDWDVKKAGLTAGTWQITAIASLNGKTLQTKDPVMLEVGS